MRLPKIKRTRRRYSALLFLLALLPLHAEDPLTLGREAFLNNQPREAVSYLSNALEAGGGTKNDYNYLGIAYQQLEEYFKAVEAFQKGIERTVPPHGQLYFNMGNNYFAAGDFQGAERAYTQAISQGTSPNHAYLNRANTRMKLEKFTDAVSDYRYFLLRVPDDPQRPVIEELIGRVEAFQLSEADRKRMEEEQRRQEEERQRALLESVLKSLETTKEDTVNLEAESEDVEGFEMEFDIED